MALYKATLYKFMTTWYEDDNGRLRMINDYKLKVKLAWTPEQVARIKSRALTQKTKLEFLLEHGFPIEECVNWENRPEDFREKRSV